MFILVLTLAAAEVSVGLGLLLLLHRRFGTLDADALERDARLTCSGCSDCSGWCPVCRCSASLLLARSGGTAADAGHSRWIGAGAVAAVRG